MSTYCKMLHNYMGRESGLDKIYNRFFYCYKLNHMFSHITRWTNWIFFQRLALFWGSGIYFLWFCAISEEKQLDRLRDEINTVQSEIQAMQSSIAVHKDRVHSLHAKYYQTALKIMKKEVVITFCEMMKIRDG